MAEETSRFGNVCLQTKRFKTATVKAKILDTERLNHIGLDMSEWRCKDLAKIKYLNKATIRTFNSSTDDSKNRPHHQEVRQPDSSSSSVSAMSSSQSGVQLSSNKSFGLKYSASMDLPNNNKPTNKMLNGLPCTSCQIPGGLIERFHSHAIISNKIPKKCNNPKRNNNESPPLDTKPEETTVKQSYFARFVKFGMGLQRRSKHGSTSSLTEGNRSNVNIFDDTKSTTNPVIRTPPPTSKSKQTDAKPRKERESSSGWLSFIEYQNDGPNVDVINEAEGRRALRQRLRKCNLCGNQFGTAGFKIHQPRCIQVSGMWGIHYHFHISTQHILVNRLICWKRTIGKKTRRQTHLPSVIR